MEFGLRVSLGLAMRTATTESVSLFTPMKYWGGIPPCSELA